MGVVCVGVARLPTTLEVRVPKHLPVGEGIENVKSPSTAQQSGRSRGRQPTRAGVLSSKAAVG
jgi:hypothetical protein